MPSPVILRIKMKIAIASEQVVLRRQDGLTRVQCNAMRCNGIVVLFSIQLRVLHVRSHARRPHPRSHGTRMRTSCGYCCAGYLAGVTLIPTCIAAPLRRDLLQYCCTALWLNFGIIAVHTTLFFGMWKWKGAHPTAPPTTTVQSPPARHS